MKLARNLHTLLRTTGMPRAYASWLFCRLLRRPGPFISLAQNVSLGWEWQSFSEYWCYRTPGQPNPPASVHALIRSTAWNRSGDAVAVDVGANVGAFTLAFCAAGFKTVHSFEPVPETYCRLSRNVIGNGLYPRVVLNCCALGEVEGYAPMHVSRSAPALARLVDSPGDRTITVPVTTLDLYAATHGLREIDFLKVDVEGHEPAVLAGAVHQLQSQRIKMILFEWCPSLIRQTRHHPEHLLAMLRSHAYEICTIDHAGQLSVLRDEWILDIEFANLVAIPSNLLSNS